MNTWQHQQQMDEQERLEEIENELWFAEIAIASHYGSTETSRRWRERINTALGLPKPSKPVPDTKEPF